MRLLVIIPDRLSSLLTKGEIQPLYYNPDNIASEVHLLMTNDDKPEIAALQYTVGNAKLFIHNFPDDLTMPEKHFTFLTPWRLRRWARQGVELISSIAPDLIRCHGVDWNTYLASQAKTKLNIPYCLSIHINPDINPVRRFLPPANAEQERHNRFYEYLEKEALIHADMVLPVYKPILPYIRRKKVSEECIQVCYNVLNRDHLASKTNYEAQTPFRLICVGRLIAEKNPIQIIKALSYMPAAELTIVGDGPIRPELEQLVKKLDLTKRIYFKPSIQNNELCQLLKKQDAFVVHTEYFELNKSVLEALLTGLPVIINRRQGEQVPEYSEGDFVHFVNNTAESYFTAMNHLMVNHAAREALGRGAFAHARARWDPTITEAAYVQVYKKLLGKRHE